MIWPFRNSKKEQELEQSRDDVEEARRRLKESREAMHELMAATLRKSADG